MNRAVPLILALLAAASLAGCGPDPATLQVEAPATQPAASQSSPQSVARQDNGPNPWLTYWLLTSGNRQTVVEHHYHAVPVPSVPGPRYAAPKAAPPAPPKVAPKPAPKPQFKVTTPKPKPAPKPPRVSFRARGH